MKYAKESPQIAGAKDFYSLSSYRVDKIGKKVWVHVTFYEHQIDGTVELSDFSHSIVDKIEYVIDPEWDNQSDPPKPEGFDPKNPATWGALSWDDIPKVPDYSKMYATRIINSVSGEETNIEKIIFEDLVQQEILPGGIMWELI